MEDLTQWFLVNVFSPLLLPIFLIGLLCQIADVRPEPVINGILGILSDIIRFAFGLLSQLVKALIPSARGRK